jgi:hypothetical protein
MIVQLECGYSNHSFNDWKIDSAGVELMVLTKGDSGWRIRAIHWSNRKTK